jgi:hypothetical protein
VLDEMSIQDILFHLSHVAANWFNKSTSNNKEKFVNIYAAIVDTSDIVIDKEYNSEISYEYWWRFLGSLQN